MSMFSSQFDRVRPLAEAYSGRHEDTGWRTPAAVLAAVAATGLAATGVMLAAGAGAEWGEGWQDGWDAPFGGGPAGDGSAGAGPADAWLDRGDYTDAGVGGDEDFFYFIDGDSSLTLG